MWEGRHKLPFFKGNLRLGGLRPPIFYAAEGLVNPVR